MNEAAETTKAQQAVEMILAHRAANEPGFIERVAMDPKGVVGPVIAEVLEDDGDLDLTDVGVTVHVQTPQALHFVISTDTEADVAGFAKGFSSGIAQRLSFDVLSPRFLDGPSMRGSTQTTCTSVDANMDKCKPSTL